jgi:hypothetical protein
VTDREKLDGFRRLERFVRAAETGAQPEANFDKLIAHENAISPSLNGRSVFDDKTRQQINRKPKQDLYDNPRQRSLF